MRSVCGFAILLVGFANFAQSSDYTLDRQFRVPAATFEELFGVPEARAMAVFGKLTGCLKQAHQDFNTVAAGKEPVHAKFESGESDGGTTHWRGKCYTLSVLKGITVWEEGESCVIGTTFGPSLKIERAGPIGATPIARTAFFPEQPCPKS